MQKDIDFDLIGRLAKIPEAKNPYEKFFLTGNPFPKSAIAEPFAASFFSRSRKEALEYIREFILYSYKSKRWAGLVLSGEYGSGKSHTLFYIYDQIRRQLGNLEADRAIAIYIEHPKDTINDLYSEIMEKIDRERFVDYVANIMVEPIAEILKKYTYKAEGFEAEDTKNPVDRLEKMGKRIVSTKKNVAWDVVSKKIVSDEMILHRDFAKCLIVMLTEKDPYLANSAWNFAIGEKIGKSEMKSLGLLSERLSEDEIIKYVFPSILRILNKNGISILFLLVDELEKIATKPQQSAFKFLENLRSLIDNNLCNFSMVMGCVSESWEIIRNLAPGLADRIGDVTRLSPLNELEAKLLIEDYLSMTRTENFEGDSYAPFDTNCFGEITRASKGSMRYILENCHKILERASIDPGIKEIDLDFVRSVMRK